MKDIKTATELLKKCVEILSDHTVAINGHNNDDVLDVVNGVETFLDEGDL